jgi:hypothetical protein
MVASMKMTAFWDMELCSLIEVAQCFRHQSTTVRLHIAISQKAGIRFI